MYRRARSQGRSASTSKTNDTDRRAGSFQYPRAGLYPRSRRFIPEARAIKQGNHLVELRFSKIRMARRVLDMKGRVAAGIMGMSPRELSRGERIDAVVPRQYEKGARMLLSFSERIRGNAESGSAGQSRGLRAMLPFRRFRCLRCKGRVHVVGSKYSARRGEHWYFKCPRCGNRFWSNNGKPHAVRPKGGNWGSLSNRVQCPDCRVDCSAAPPASKSIATRRWECPKCRRRYRNIGGRAVLAG